MLAAMWMMTRTTRSVETVTGVAFPARLALRSGMKRPQGNLRGDGRGVEVRRRERLSVKAEPMRETGTRLAAGSEPARQQQINRIPTRGASEFERSRGLLIRGSARNRIVVSA
jgi:hypothetical protein